MPLERVIYHVQGRPFPQYHPWSMVNARGDRPFPENLTHLGASYPPDIDGVFFWGLRLMDGRGGIKAFDGACLAPRVAAIAVCFLLANCASSDKFARNVDPKYGVSSSPRVVDARRAGPEGRRRLSRRQALCGRRAQTYTPEDERGLQHRGHGLLVRRRFPRPADRQWRSLRHERDHGRASDVADAVLCPRHQSGEQEIA